MIFLQPWPNLAGPTSDNYIGRSASPIEIEPSDASIFSRPFKEGSPSRRRRLVLGRGRQFDEMGI